MEHRCSTRYPFVTDIIIRPLDKPDVHCRTKDICLEGVCIVAEGIDLPIHSVVDIELNLSNPESTDLKLHGLLVHLENDCAGIMFTQLDEAAQEHIARFINQIRINPL